MKERRLRRALAELPLPGEDEASERTWRVVAAAYAETERVPPRRRPPVRLVAVLAVLGALAVAFASSPGRAVLDSVRRTIGIEHAQPALFSLPARGSLVVASRASGAWIVHADGSKRRLGDYAEAPWSPFGRFVVASRRDGLAALDLDGHVHWTLSRRDVRFPRWGGGRVDTRIAYLSGSRLRIVAGDGTEDRVVAGLPAAAPVAPAWRPGKGFLLAYADRGGRVLVVDPSGGVRFETATRARPRKLEWSSDGRLLLVVAPRGLHVYDANGRLVAHDAPPSESHDLDASFVAGGREVAILRRRGGESDVVLLGSNRLIFRTSGELAQIVSSPDGRWLLASWPAADQWVFVRIRGVRRLAADGDIARQFGGFPTIAGWCCATS